MSEHVPGKSSRPRANRRYLIRVALVITTLCFLVLIARNGIQTRMTIGYISCVLALVGLELVIPMLSRLFARQAHAVRGAKAEETIGAILNRLSEKHRVFHDVLTPFGKIDHLVFRDDGALFVIETKSHRGQVTIDRNELRRDGQPFETNFIKHILNIVSSVKKSVALNFGFTPTWVHAAIVFTDARVPSHCALFNVAVIQPGYLESWMADQSGANPASLHLWSRKDDLQRIIEQNSRS
jgi:Nuclease-related domain